MCLTIFKCKLKSSREQKLKIVPAAFQPITGLLRTTVYLYPPSSKNIKLYLKSKLSKPNNFLETP